MLLFLRNRVRSVTSRIRLDLQQNLRGRSIVFVHIKSCGRRIPGDMIRGCDCDQAAYFAFHQGGRPVSAPVALLRAAGDAARRCRRHPRCASGGYFALAGAATTSTVDRAPAAWAHSLATLLSVRDFAARAPNSSVVNLAKNRESPYLLKVR